MACRLEDRWQLNHDVLERARCTVGLLVDRSHRATGTSFQTPLSVAPEAGRTLVQRPDGVPVGEAQHVRHREVLHLPGRRRHRHRGAPVGRPRGRAAPVAVLRELRVAGAGHVRGEDGGDARRDGRDALAAGGGARRAAAHGADGRAGAVGGGRH
ncbi:hypothetical protein BS78_01G130500 [Paspalum vaginatum]|nr:hypothetical protein BS78_01G130500 [Paspalum vaginatum]